MEIRLSGYQNNLFYLDVQRRPVSHSTEPAAPASPAVFRPSSLTLLAASSSFSEVSIQNNSLTMAYRRDGVAMRLQSSLDVSLRSRTTSLDVILPAESLGIELPAELFQAGPLQLSLDYRLETTEADSAIKVQTVRPTRKAEDILMDLSEAIVQVLQRKGDKNLQVLFDEEAIQALFADSKTARLMNEIAGLITMINSMIVEGGPRDRYTIAISGKGKPFLDVQEQTRVRAETTAVRLNLMILPPQEAEEPALPEQAAPVE